MNNSNASTPLRAVFSANFSKSIVKTFPILSDDSNFTTPLIEASKFVGRSTYNIAKYSGHAIGATASATASTAVGCSRYAGSGIYTAAKHTGNGLFAAIRHFELDRAVKIVFRSVVDWLEVAYNIVSSQWCALLDSTALYSWIAKWWSRYYRFVVCHPYATLTIIFVSMAIWTASFHRRVNIPPVAQQQNPPNILNVESERAEREALKSISDGNVAIMNAAILPCPVCKNSPAACQCQGGSFAQVTAQGHASIARGAVAQLNIPPPPAQQFNIGESFTMRSSLTTPVGSLMDILAPWSITRMTISNVHNFTDTRPSGDRVMSVSDSIFYRLEARHFLSLFGYEIPLPDFFICKGTSRNSFFVPQQHLGMARTPAFEEKPFRQIAARIKGDSSIPSSHPSLLQYNVIIPRDSAWVLNGLIEGRLPIYGDFQ